MHRLSAELTPWLLIISMVVAIMAAGCVSEDESALVGEYTAAADEGGATVTLTLKPDNKGEWATDEDNTGFRWQRQGKDLLLHTHEGGVIVGQIHKEGLTVRLPGGKTYHFKRTPN